MERLRVWGDMACFTREMKVERVSYPCMTPPAGRGVLEAVFWKPEFVWQVRSIAVLKPIAYASITRNEIADRQSFQAAQRWVATRDGYEANHNGHRVQRHSRILTNVDYLITADIVLRQHATDPIIKYSEQFRRRVAKGQCWQRPFLGCREFVAFFREPDGTETAIDLTGDLGSMLLRVNYTARSNGEGIPQFFQARLENGVLNVPQEGN
jgi:CRISPR-associated protein Cas5d